MFCLYDSVWYSGLNVCQVLNNVYLKAEKNIISPPPSPSPKECQALCWALLTQTVLNLLKALRGRRKRLCQHMDEETEGRLGQVINRITAFTNSRVRSSSPIFTVAKCLFVEL